MVPPASPGLIVPASLAVLAHRYGAGAPAVVDLIRRTGGCTSPIRLEGESVAVSAGSGAVLARRSTRSEAPGFVLVACGNRRESRCPPCSERYRRDAYFLVAAGLSGSEEKGVSTDVASHPLVFATFTAPSFGAVHRRVVDAGGVRQCRVGGQAQVCEHGVPLRCLERHAQGDPRIGQALCPDCYDYEAATLWNANLGALWRRTITYLPRELAALAGLSVAALRNQVRVAYAKVAEFQARGAVHVHAVIRLDGPDGPDTAPAGGATAQRLAEAVARTAARVAVTVDGPDGRELVVRWGMQVDVRPITRNASGGDADGNAVAGYLAKYATKDAGRRWPGPADPCQGSDRASRALGSCPKADANGLDPESALGTYPGLSRPLPNEGPSLFGDVCRPARRPGAISSAGRSVAHSDPRQGHRRPGRHPTELPLRRIRVESG
jgi:hypothetical protein